MKCQKTQTLRVLLFLCLPLLSQCNTREVYEWIQIFSHPKHMGATQQILVACNTPVAPHAPTGLAASPGSSGVIVLTWDAQPGCTFNVFSDSGSYFDATGTSLNWNIGLPGQTVYNITLVAVDILTGLESPPSSPPIEGISGS